RGAERRSERGGHGDQELTQGAVGQGRHFRRTTGAALPYTGGAAPVVLPVLSPASAPGRC
ncbi:hypothetical protein, partial [Streptomyces sp. T21Q-yed]|uniref:hypothetical protein n=1 Tax=Streptomyces sp. T21Q-yed TaxID=3018441 RepID=UPI0023DEC28A